MFQTLGKAVSAVIEGLREQPAVLSLTVVLIALIVWQFYALRAAAEFRTLLITQQSEYNKYVTELISRCIATPRTDDLTVPWPQTTGIGLSPPPP